MTAFKRGDHVDLADALVRELGEWVVTADGAVYVYNDALGIWRVVPSAVQSRIVHGFAHAPAGDKAKPLNIRVHDVAGALQIAQQSTSIDGFFDAAPAGIAFANGFVSVDGHGARLTPHSLEHRCRYAMPFAYEERTSERWDGFLQALFRDDVDRDAKIDCLGEFFGLCLFGQVTKFQKVIIASGEGENGKSTLAKIISATFPPGSISAIAPQDMGQEYRRALLAGKRLNVVSELPEAKIIAGEAFKAIVTGDQIIGRHIRETPFSFSPVAGHYFAANRLPGTNDQSEGFWRRMLVVQFNRSFKDDPEKNLDIAETLIREDLPAVCAWMLQGAVRALRQGGYSEPASHGKELAAWRRGADQVAQFFEACCTAGHEHETLASAVYQAYRTWAISNGHHHLLASNAFGMRMGKLGHSSRKKESANVYALKVSHGR